ncbi:PREDICTED: D-aspartate oxidase [Dufourea novaeangliae]|uniref:D-aspartate oxidase n=1 Tax=Dufourea novaeangliae TaxID=178035 RepID=UPI000767305C|nr:PREDICTED: D-aspartate oxidase [Dufourea novaeangliae]
MSVAVVGAGVIGMTTSVALKTAFPELKVHVFAEDFSPNTTGDGSAGLWGPYLLGDTPREKVLKWAGTTHRWLEEFWRTGRASEIGISLLPIYRVTSDPHGFPDSSWTKLVYGAHRLTSKDLTRLNEEYGTNYKDGWMFVTYTSEPARLLPWLEETFVASGGELRRRKIETLHELIDDGYDSIINCSGLGARRLAGDITVTPVRGQVARVTASWAMHGHIVDDEDSHYIIPNYETTVLGGTHQMNDYDCSPRKEDSKFIYDGCCRILPALKGVTSIKEWVGLRPGRPTVRLESEVLESSQGKKFTVIHNYGHGGSGVTLSWGCALDVVAIFRDTWRLKSNL